MYKVFQRRLLSVLSYRWGVIIIIIGSLVILNSLLDIAHHFLPDPNVLQYLSPEYSGGQWQSKFGLSTSPSPSQWNPPIPFDFSDNLLQQSFEGHLASEPIDIVYTWVNGSDSKLQKDIAFWKKHMGITEGSSSSSSSPHPSQMAQNDSQTTHSTLSTRNSSSLHNDSSNSPTSSGGGDDNISANRFRDNEELRYSLRSIWKYAPWVRRVWIVTNGQVPHWLNVDHPRIAVIPHSDIFPNISHLPTFSSPAIESHLHRIPGLANRFIYFNDDVMLGNSIYPDDFVTQAQGYKVFLSWNVPNCANGCPDSWIGDKYCDNACNTQECNWDGGDCVNVTDSRYHSYDSSRGYSSSSSSYASPSRYCASGCPNNWVGDKVCDRSCKNAECAFDGGDCGLDLVVSGLPGVELEAESHAFEISYETTAIYVNLSTIFPSNILEASHDNSNFVRSAIITQHLHLLTLIFFPEKDIVEEKKEEENKNNAHDSNSTQADASSPSSDASPPSATPIEPPPRVVEIFIQGEHNGHVLNVTFFVQRPRVPDEEQAGEGGEGGESSTGMAGGEGAGASQSSHAMATATIDGNDRRLLGKKRSQKPFISHFTVSSSSPSSSSSSPSSPFILVDNRKRVHVFDRPPQRLLPKGKMTALLSSQDNKKFSVEVSSENPSTTVTVTSPSPLSSMPSTPMPSPSLYTTLRDLYDSRRRTWRDMVEISVEGVPLSADHSSGIKLKGDVPSFSTWGSLLPSTRISVGPHGEDVIIESVGWDGSDYKLADHLETLKKKELWSIQEREAKDGMLRALEERHKQITEGNSPSAPVIWPWELEVDDRVYDPDLLEYVWHIVDEWERKREENMKKEMRVEIDEYGMMTEYPSSSMDSHGHGGHSHGDVDEDTHNVFSVLRGHLRSSIYSHEHQENPWLYSSPEHLLADHLADSSPSESPDSSDSDDFLLLSRLSAETEKLNASAAALPHRIINPHKRKLLDTFGDSLRFVNGLYTSEYGRETRKAPAHMPHFIDRRVMDELQRKWKNQYDDTSSHRFRHSKDMQFAFAYFYYLMHEPKDFNLREVWENSLDIDRDGELSSMEIRHAVLFISGRKIHDDQVEQLEDILRNVSMTMGHEGRIDYETIESTDELIDALKDRIRLKKKFRHEVVNLDQVEFYMVPDNTSKVQTRLDEIRAKMPKFICLNDDMNKTHDPPLGTLKALKNFYLSYFPTPCPFELPPGKINSFGYIQEWRHKKINDALLSFLILIIGSVGLLCCIWMFALPLSWKKRIQSALFGGTQGNRPLAHQRLSSIV